MFDRFIMMNMHEGRMCEQGAFRFKAEAIREARESAERTERINEKRGEPVENRSRLFIVVDRETGEVVGGKSFLEV